MKQWITTLSFLLGILVVHFVELPWIVYIPVAAVGFILFLLHHWHKANPWIMFVWNVCMFGAMYGSIRTQIHVYAADDEEPSPVERISEKARDYSRTCLMKCGIAEEDVAVLNAMLLGNRKDLTKEQKLQFRNAGAQHLLALSGLHLGIFIGALSFLFLKRARFTRWRWFVLTGCLSLLWGYCFLAGMPQSLLRAMLMTTLFYFSLFRTHESRGSLNLINTLLLMLIIDPFCVFDIGTQLSFSAVGAIVWLYPILERIIPYQIFPSNRLGELMRRVWQLFMVSVTAWLGTMPLCLYYFHQFQPWQPLSSVILVPLTSLLLYLALLLMILCVLGLWFVAIPFAKVVALCMQAEYGVLDFAGELPVSTLHCPHIHLGHICLLYLLFFIMGVSIQAPKKVQYVGGLALLFVLVLLFLV